MKLILCLAILTLNLSSYLTNMLYFQQNHYNIPRQINHYKHYYIPLIKHTIYSLPLVLLLLINTYEVFIRSTIGIIFIVAYILLLNFKKHKWIKPLVYTLRVYRFTILYNILNFVAIYGLVMNTNSYSIILVIILYEGISQAIFILTAIIIQPIEKQIKNYYIRIAKKKLYTNNNLIKIAISGSYGKTSTKFILNELLKDRYYTLMTPHSYNNDMGISKCINERLNKFHDIFIIEVGADHVGEITKLAKFIKPDYALITSIGPQHLETFKTMPNIIHEKMQLIEFIKPSGTAFINLDNYHIKNYHIYNNINKITYSLEDPSANYYATNITYNSKGSSFDIIHNNLTYHYSTILLGKHNISNILSAIVIANYLNISMQTLISYVSNLNYIEHRLQLIQRGNYTIIDNSYNSNPSSAKNSLEVLSKMPNIRIIITPGMVDLGRIQELENYNFGTLMKDKTDIVILVGERITKQLYLGLKESSFNMHNVYITSSFKEAYSMLDSLAKVATVLIENDLPDNFII
ncbi:MAG: UDP-N-acetylmuramoyl-tripeptide--D-alanyl-D-alanine ligase [Erysipelotrichaceae bacterium]